MYKTTAVDDCEKVIGSTGRISFQFPNSPVFVTVQIYYYSFGSFIQGLPLPPSGAKS